MFEAEESLKLLYNPNLKKHRIFSQQSHQKNDKMMEQQSISRFQSNDALLLLCVFTLLVRIGLEAITLIKTEVWIEVGTVFWVEGLN